MANTSGTCTIDNFCLCSALVVANCVFFCLKPTRTFSKLLQMRVFLVALTSSMFQSLLVAFSHGSNWSYKRAYATYNIIFNILKYGLLKPLDVNSTTGSLTGSLLRRTNFERLEGSLKNARENSCSQTLVPHVRSALLPHVLLWLSKIVYFFCLMLARTFSKT